MKLKAALHLIVSSIVLSTTVQGKTNKKALVPEIHYHKPNADQMREDLHEKDNEKKLDDLYDSGIQKQKKMLLFKE